jgi:hypothetical protein
MSSHKKNSLIIRKMKDSSKQVGIEHRGKDVFWAVFINVFAIINNNISLLTFVTRTRPTSIEGSILGPFGIQIQVILVPIKNTYLH